LQATGCGLEIYFNFNYQDIPQREREREREREGGGESQDSMLNTLLGFFGIIMVAVNCDDHNQNIALEYFL